MVKLAPQSDVGDAASVGTSVNTEVFQAALGHGTANNDQGSTDGMHTDNEDDGMNTDNESNNGNDPQQAGARTSPPVSTEADHSDEGGRHGL